ncbi:Signal transduction histidine kinase [Brevibacterium sp. Mu109]|nr:Signal transduction histidine kinase [Brevibacterium sp. Mu109]
MSDRSPTASVARMSFSSTASRARSVLRAHPWITDGLLWAAPVAWLSVSSVQGRVWVDTTSTTPQWVHFAVALLMTAPLALRRRAPLVSSVLIATGCALSLLTGAGPSMAVIAVPLTVFSSAKWGSRTDSRIVLGLGLVGSLAMGLWAYMAALQSSMGPGGRPIDGSEYSALSALIILCAAIVLSAWLLGILAHRRRTAVEDIRERNRLLEKERESESRLAADAERMRIAREMHDIIAHSLSVVIAQADGGRYAAKSNPAAAEDALTTIAATGRDALAQTRNLLGVLRTDSLTDAATSPMPGLAAVPSLVDDLRATGLAVSIDGFDAPEKVGHLSEGAGLAVYRIVQEALTNVLKHAGSGARAQVALSTTDQGLIVRVSDDGGPVRSHAGRAGAAEAGVSGAGVSGAGVSEAGAAGAGISAAGASGKDTSVLEGAGSGIIGMRERATLYGGSLEAGPRRGGERGFTVTARFPSAGRPASEPTAGGRPAGSSPAAGPPASDPPEARPPEASAPATKAPEATPPAQTALAPSATEAPVPEASTDPAPAGATNNRGASAEVASAGVPSVELASAGMTAEDPRADKPHAEEYQQRSAHHD